MANLVLRKMTSLHFLSQLTSFFLLPLSSDASFEQVFYKRLEKTYLSNHVFQTVFVRGEIECGLQCLREEACLSVNFGTAQKNGSDVCELNNASIEMSNKTDVSERVGFTHLDPMYPFGSKRRPGKSCLDVLTRTAEPSFLSSGEYWINNINSNGPLKVFCDRKTGGGKSCHDIKAKGLDLGDGEYMIDPDGGSDENAFKVYCDMTSFGGGWTMCYTTDNHVNIKTEVSSKFAYGIDGYRANCNDIPFTDVMFVDEKTKKKASFTKTGPAITFSNNYNKSASAYGQWNGHGVASDSLKYQLMICDTSFYKGLLVCGYTESCYKSCDSWCVDYTSSYFRTAAVNDGYYGGVAFNVNGYRPQGKHLISAGIR